MTDREELQALLDADLTLLPDEALVASIKYLAEDALREIEAREELARRLQSVRTLRPGDEETEASMSDPRFDAGLEMIGRTGATSFQLRFQADDEPVLWVAAAEYGAGTHWIVGAGLFPLEAVMNLCEEVIDGGICAHCRRPTAFDGSAEAEPNPLSEVVCMYTFDPDRNAFRRGCDTGR